MTTVGGEITEGELDFLGDCWLSGVDDGMLLVDLVLMAALRLLSLEPSEEEEEEEGKGAGCEASGAGGVSGGAKTSLPVEGKREWCEKTSPPLLPLPLPPLCPGETEPPLFAVPSAPDIGASARDVMVSLVLGERHGGCGGDGEGAAACFEVVAGEGGEEEAELRGGAAELMASL